MTTGSNGASRPQIELLNPPAAIAGGDFELRGDHLSSDQGVRPIVRFGDVAGRLVVGASRRIVVKVPAEADASRLEVETASGVSEPLDCSIGLRIAESLHPVANPAVDDAGNVYTTRSGSRGEKVPVSVFKIDTELTVRTFASDIMNPTGLVVDPSGVLLVSSRQNGTIYSVDAAGEVSTYAEGMGVATGIALDDEGSLYVGDRTGTIFKIGRDRQIFVFATMEPSISAYHLAFGADGYLYVTGPTTSSHDAVQRVAPNGDVEVFLDGFGRPQGLAFDRAGNLYVTASRRGQRGVFRIRPDKTVDLVVSGPSMVGLAFLPNQDMVVTTNSDVYRVSTAGWIER